MLEKSITFIASCDFCSETFETDEYEFLSAVEAIKKAGWSVFKKLGEWFHKCDCCLAKEADEDFGVL